MGVVLNPDSELAIEQAKWNKPYRYEPFPRMLYLAHEHANGKVQCGDPRVAMGDQEAEAFTRRCQRIVRSEQEMGLAIENGWRESPDDAIALVEGAKRDVSTAAAERHFADQRLSPKARAEAAEVDAATDAHVADVPAPKRRRGRPSKVAE